MASLNNSITIEVRTGPVLRAATRLLRSADEVADLIPDWHAEERERFERRVRKLRRAVLREMRDRS